MHVNRHDRRALARLERRDDNGSGNQPSLREISEMVGKLNGTFAEFRAANDTRIKEVEKRGAADPTTTATVERLNGEVTKLSDQLREMETRAERRGGGGGAGERPEVTEHRTAWNGWVRKGSGETELRTIERRANTTLSPEDGGLLVPETVDRNILTVLDNESQVRSLFDSITVSSDSYTRLVGFHGAGAGWVGETDARPATNGPQFGEASATFGELYANPQVSQKLLDDAAVDMEAYISTEIARAFGLLEAQAYLFGDGVKKPKGLFAMPMSTAKDGVRPFGTFQVINTGSAADLPANQAATDKLIDLIYSLKSGYRQNAQWALNGLTLASVRKLKDGDGNYLWQPSPQAGTPSQLLGFPVNDIGELPDVAANSLSIAFGDFKRAYQIVDRIGIRTLRDPFTNKPYVGFYTTKRTGGVPLDSQAVKFLKTAA